jgi:hypothetical protein
MPTTRLSAVTNCFRATRPSQEYGVAARLNAIIQIADAHDRQELAGTEPSLPAPIPANQSSHAGCR